VRIRRALRARTCERGGVDNGAKPRVAGRECVFGGGDPCGDRLHRIHHSIRPGKHVHVIDQCNPDPILIELPATTSNRHGTSESGQLCAQCFDAAATEELDALTRCNPIRQVFPGAGSQLRSVRVSPPHMAARTETDHRVDNASGAHAGTLPRLLSECQPSGSPVEALPDRVAADRDRRNDINCRRSLLISDAGGLR
jgi:hypothetical protein